MRAKSRTEGLTDGGSPPAFRTVLPEGQRGPPARRALPALPARPAAEAPQPGAGRSGGAPRPRAAPRAGPRSGSAGRAAEPRAAPCPRRGRGAVARGGARARGGAAPRAGLARPGVMPRPAGEALPRSGASPPAARLGVQVERCRRARSGAAQPGSAQRSPAQPREQPRRAPRSARPGGRRSRQHRGGTARGCGRAKNKSPLRGHASGFRSAAGKGPGPAKLGSLPPSSDSPRRPDRAARRFPARRGQRPRARRPPAAGRPAGAARTPLRPAPEPRPRALGFALRAAGGGASGEGCVSSRGDFGCCVSPPPRLAVTAAARRGAAPRSGSCMGPRASASTACPRPRSPVSPAGRRGPRPGLGVAGRGGALGWHGSGRAGVWSEKSELGSSRALRGAPLPARGSGGARGFVAAERGDGVRAACDPRRAGRFHCLFSSALSATEWVSGFRFRKQNSRTETGLRAGKVPQGYGRGGSLDLVFWMVSKARKGVCQ